MKNSKIMNRSLMGIEYLLILESIDSNDKIKLPFEEESDGTVKLYNMYDTFSENSN